MKPTPPTEPLPALPAADEVVDDVKLPDIQEMEE